MNESLSHAPVIMNCVVFPVVMGLIEVLWKLGVKICLCYWNTVETL